MITPSTTKPKKGPKRRKEKRVYTEKGRRVQAWLKPEQLRTWDQLTNKSAFLQLACDDAAGIMTMEILRKRKPEQYTDHYKLEDVIDQWNESHPLDELTLARQRVARIRRDNPGGDSGADSELW